MSTVLAHGDGCFVALALCSVALQLAVSASGLRARCATTLAAAMGHRQVVVAVGIVICFTGVCDIGAAAPGVVVDLSAAAAVSAPMLAAAPVIVVLATAKAVVGVAGVKLVGNTIVQSSLAVEFLTVVVVDI